MPKKRWTDEDLKKAIKTSDNYSDVLRKLGLCAHGGCSRQSVKNTIEDLNLDASHFLTPAELSRRNVKKAWAAYVRPLKEILVKSKRCNTSGLKRRLFREGLKQRRCELCGQDEIWCRKRMSLILDHVNGDRTDNRIENLRIVCPNCNSTLPTFAGRNNRNRFCPSCKEKVYGENKYCSAKCRRTEIRPRIYKRKVIRPEIEQITKDVEILGYVGTGKKYGVTDNAVRKWIRAEGLIPPRKYKTTP